MRCTIQRHCDPALVRKLWDAITYVRQQKQIANVERIQRYLLREHDMRAAEVKEHMDQAVEDTLIDQYTAVGFKGSKVGQEQAGYRMPDGVDVDKGDHDWYCFTCHKPGEVLCCSECWRVYHTTCTESDWSGSKFLCGVCKQMRHKQKIKRKELNKLLAYTVNRLKEKVNTSKELHALFKQEEEGRWRQFIYQEMDLNSMEEKCLQKKYKYLEQFQADAQTIYHNVMLCYGEFGSMADIVKIMIRDCKYDVDEVRLCKDCYWFSNAKPKDWFCKPCHPPHTLVFAKQKGFSYWPAKVIRDTKEGFDVRFFGGWHQRAVIPKTSVKDIDTNMKTLNIKKTSGFSRAMEELKRHQAVLETVTPEGSAAETETDNASGDDEDETPVKKVVTKKKEKKPLVIEEQDGDDEEFTRTDPVRKKPGRKKKSIVIEQDEDTPIRMKGKKRPCYMPEPEEEEEEETPVKQKRKKIRKSHTGTPKRKKSLDDTEMDITPSPRKKKKVPTATLR